MLRTVPRMIVRKVSVYNRVSHQTRVRVPPETTTHHTCESGSGRRHNSPRTCGPRACVNWVTALQGLLTLRSLTLCLPHMLRHHSHRSPFRSFCLTIERPPSAQGGHLGDTSSLRCPCRAFAGWRDTYPSRCCFVHEVYISRRKKTERLNLQVG